MRSRRLTLIQKFTQPAASVADVAASYMGEMLYWVMQAALAVYNQLAAMKVLPQITTGMLGFWFWGCSVAKYHESLASSLASAGRFPNPQSVGHSRRVPARPVPAPLLLVLVLVLFLSLLLLPLFLLMFSVE